MGEGAGGKRVADPAQRHPQGVGARGILERTPGFQFKTFLWELTAILKQKRMGGCDDDSTSSLKEHSEGGAE